MSAIERSEFLVIFVPTDESGLDIVVEEYPDAQSATEAVIAAKDQAHWRDAVGVYKHHGDGVLMNKWWVGAASLYGRRFARDTAEARDDGEQ